MTDLLRMKGVTVTFRGGGWLRRTSTCALSNVDLSVQEGESVGLVGESGCGKSTLARVAAGLVSVDSGEVDVLGQRVDRTSPSVRDVQLIYQNVDAHVDPHWTARRLLRESADVHGRQDADVNAILERVGLSHRAEVAAGMLSGGERRRLGVARVLLARPRLLLADEPCAGVDAARRVDLATALLEHSGPSSGLLLITHDLALVQAVCDRVVVMLGGRVVEECAKIDLARVPHHPYTRALLQASGQLSGAVPLLQAASSKGCPIAAQCSSARDSCKREVQRLQRVPDAGASTNKGVAHRIACPVPVESR